MPNFNAQFITNFATITVPLRVLTHKGTKFSWNKEHEDSYQKLKRAIVNSPVMRYIDTSNEAQIHRGCQPGRGISDQTPPGKNTLPNTIAYASRALISTEQRYSQKKKIWLSSGESRISIYIFTEHLLPYIQTIKLWK